MGDNSNDKVVSNSVSASNSGGVIGVLENLTGKMKGIAVIASFGMFLIYLIYAQDKSIVDDTPVWGIGIITISAMILHFASEIVRVWFKEEKK